MRGARCTRYRLGPSDIKGKYVGESSQAVANAFAEGKSYGGEPIFDEVHSYLPARKEAEKDHEIDLVNQFLISMETALGFSSAPPI